MAPFAPALSVEESRDALDVEIAMLVACITAAESRPAGRARDQALMQYGRMVREARVLRARLGDDE